MLPVFIFIMGMAVAPVTAMNPTTPDLFNNVPDNTSDSDNSTWTFNDNLTAHNEPFTIPTTDMGPTAGLTTAATMNSTITNSTLTTQSKGEVSQGVSQAPLSTAAPERSTSTPSAAKPTPSTTSKAPQLKTTAAKPLTGGSNSTGLVILIVIIIVAVGFAIACFVARKRGRRYSVDFTSRPDEANIPLSTVDPDLPLDDGPQNGMQTFESKETAEKEPEEQVQEEQKAEADKSEASAETAAPPPPPDGSEDKPKEDVVEQSPSPPSEPSVEEKSDEGAASNKTSVESLKETNENNSNNVDFSWMRDASIVFWEVPLDSPV